MAKPKPPEPLSNWTMRVPESLGKRIDELVAESRKANGQVMSRNEYLNAVLEKVADWGIVSEPTAPKLITRDGPPLDQRD